jgi:hypothetical protein
MMGDRPLTCCFAVGVTGFEPAASSSRTKRATKLRHTPWSLVRIAERPRHHETGSSPRRHPPLKSATRAALEPLERSPRRDGGDHRVG